MSHQNSKDKAFEAFDQARMAEPVHVVVDPEVLVQIEAANTEAAQELLERKQSGRKPNPPGSEDSVRYEETGSAKGSRHKYVRTKEAQIKDAREQVQEAELPENVLRIP